MAGIDSAMLELARAAMDRAYAPYSNYPVGAVVRGSGGRLYAGCNVENAAYPLGSCAETGAIAAMVVDGETRIAAIAVAAGGAQLVTPCGGCRQRLREFAAHDVPVYVAGVEGHRATIMLGELLPHAFGPNHLA